MVLKKVILTATVLELPSLNATIIPSMQKPKGRNIDMHGSFDLHGCTQEVRNLDNHGSYGLHLNR